MADPITPQTPIPSFNLNLEPAIAPVKETTSPVVPTLNIEPAIDQTVEPESTPTEPIIEAKVEPTNTENIAVEVIPEQTTPIILDIPAAPISKDPEIEAQIPNTEINEEPIQNPNNTPNTEEQTNNNPTQTPEENNQTPPTDDRLKKEDELVQEQTEITAPVEPEQTPAVTETPVVEEVKAPVVETVATATIEPIIPEIKVPSTDLQKDLQIIQNLQQTPAVPVSTPTPQVVQAIIEAPKPAPANSLNLDSITATIPQIPAAQIPPTPIIGGIPTAPQIPLNPYDHMQNYIPQIAPSTQNGSKSQNKGGIIGIVVGIGFIVLAWFVIKTMYPIQYKDAIGSIMGTSEDTISSKISNTLSGSEISEDIGSGSLETGNSILEDGLLDGLTGSELSGDIHNTADTESGSSQAGIMATAALEDFKTKLESYSSQGKAKVVEAKKAGNKAIIQDSLMLYKKADGYLLDIANGKEMTTTEIETITAELSGYLNKIDPTANAEVATGTEENTTPTNTGSPDFNPDEFFSESGNTQQ